jgi:UDPglucose 6-dehydrogenase
MREAPSLVVIDDLLRRGARVVAYDPVATGQARLALQGMNGAEGVRFAASAQEALAGADALLIVTEWREFRSPDFDAMRAALKQPVIIDGRNLFEPALVKAHGLEYTAIGRAVASTQGA